MAKKRVAPARAKKSDKPSASKSEPPLRFLVVEARFYREYSDLLLEGATPRAYGSRCRARRDHRARRARGSCGHRDGARSREGEARGVRRRRRSRLRHSGRDLSLRLVSNESARALMELSVDLQLPLGNGILTVDTDEQAQARARRRSRPQRRAGRRTPRCTWRGSSAS